MLGGGGGGGGAYPPHHPHHGSRGYLDNGRNKEHNFSLLSGFDSKNYDSDIRQQ
jgi:hypothetical protein